MSVVRISCGVAVLALVAASGSGASAAKSGLVKCKPTANEQGLSAIDIRVKNITCAKARKQVKDKDAYGYKSTSGGCKKSVVDTTRTCRYRVSRFACVSKTRRVTRKGSSYPEVNTKCVRDRQIVHLRFATGGG